MARASDILIADDSRMIRLGYKSLFENAGYSVRTARDGAEALRKFSERRPDLVVLDVMMPGVNGPAACVEMRQLDPLVPILFVTAMPSDVGAVTSLGYGADDYIDKAKSKEELLARVAAALRRQSAVKTARGELRVGAMTFDCVNGVVSSSDGTSAELTKSESALLRLLASDRGRVFTFDELFAALRGEGCRGDDNAMRCIAKHLKAKLGAAGELIVNVRGVGYKLLR